MVPAVDDARQQRCAAPGGADITAATNLPVLDGSRSNCGWGIDPTAVEPGLFGPGSLPALSRNDFVANSNDSPWLVNPAAPLTGFPLDADRVHQRAAAGPSRLDVTAPATGVFDRLGPVRYPPPMASKRNTTLEAMIEEATVDAYGEHEELTGLFTMLEEHLVVPFTTTVLGVEVTVRKLDLTDDAIVAVCSRGRERQRIDLLDLPLPAPPPDGAVWIDAYRRWAGR